MKIIKKTAESVKLQDAHEKEGLRKLFVFEDEFSNIQGISQSFLEPGKKFTMHVHENANEFMFVIKGSGVVRDEDGEYSFKPGDFFVFPKGVYHEQENTGKEMFEAIFVRVK